MVEIVTVHPIEPRPDGDGTFGSPVMSFRVEDRSRLWTAIMAEMEDAGLFEQPVLVKTTTSPNIYVIQFLAPGGGGWSDEYGIRVFPCPV